MQVAKILQNKGSDVFMGHFMVGFPQATRTQSAVPRVGHRPTLYHLGVILKSLVLRRVGTQVMRMKRTK